MSNFFKKSNLIAVIFCCFYFFITLASTASIDYKNFKYWGNAITTDEMAHIPSGYYYLKTGKYFLNVEHPPLIKDLSALPLLLYKPHFPEIKEDKTIDEGVLWHQYPPKEFTFSKNLEIQNAQWDWAAIFLFNPKNDPSLITFLARLSVIIFNTIFLFLLYLFLSKTWSKRIALVSLFSIVFLQFNIAQGSLVAMDFMSSLLQMIAIVTFSIYIRNFVKKKYYFKSLLTSIFFLSLALLSKFSSIILIPTIFIGGLIYVITKQRNLTHIAKYFLNFIIFIGLNFFVIAIYYYFHTYNMEGRDIIAQINYLHPDKTLLNLKDILIISADNSFLKGATQYISGILMVFSRLDVAYQQIYFMGNFYGSEGAGLLYFPILYLTKMPIGLLLLNLFGILIVIWKFFSSHEPLKDRFVNFLKNPLMLFFLIFIYLFTVTTISSNLQIGLRHILPIIFAITILTAKAIGSFWNEEVLKIKIKYFFIIIFSSIFLSVMLSFPNYLEYYNFFGHGTTNGYKIATDSNYDWGQGTKKIVKFVEKNKIDQIYIDVDAEADIPLYWYLGDKIKIIDIKKDSIPSSGSYLALSMTNYETLREKYPSIKKIGGERIDETIIIIQIP
ncbi:MAG: hypothetical protein WC819_05525 [Parcubacteria group bacterium]